MKRWRILLFVIGIVSTMTTIAAWSDAILLPQGTTIAIPGSMLSVLDGPYFLLTRPDMEIALLAMETVPIREAQIAKLTTSYKTLQDGIFWNTVKWSALTGAVVFLAVEVFHLVKGN